VTVAGDSHRRLSAAKSISDVEAGDYVRRAVGSGMVGRIESDPVDGHAWITWSPERREYLPLAAVRKVRPGGSEFDVRR
jgi:hypothetical protein